MICHGNRGFVTQAADVLKAERYYFKINRVGAANQFINNLTFTVVQLNNIVADAGGWWDNINFRFVPQVAGNYFFNALLRIEDLDIDNWFSVYLFKNGVNTIAGLLNDSGAINAEMQAHVQGWIGMNGSTDYVDLQVVHANGDNTPFVPGTLGQRVFLEGFLLEKT